jgi:hypothetical protein
MQVVAVSMGWERTNSDDDITEVTGDGERRILAATILT